MSDQPVEPTDKRVYRRSRWKHYIRFLFLPAILLVDWSFISASWRIHVIEHRALTADLIGKELAGYVVAAFCNLMILPSIVFEADSIEVEDKQVVFNNLIFRQTIPYTDIQSVSVPYWLKFAIIRTKGFFQLVNKKDIPDFNELIQTIKTKAGLPSG